MGELHRPEWNLPKISTGTRDELLVDLLFCFASRSWTGVPCTACSDEYDTGKNVQKNDKKKDSNVPSVISLVDWLS